MMELQLYLEPRPLKHLLAAVNDLVTYMERSGAVRLSRPIHPRGDSETGIWIGRTPASLPFKEKLGNPNHDRYFIMGNGSKLVKTGKTPGGTANGIYAFLQHFMGVSWFAPGDIFELVPRAEGFKLPVVEETSIPSFPLGIVSGVPGMSSPRICCGPADSGGGFEALCGFPGKEGG